MSTKSHIHKGCGALRKKLFSTRGYAEIHIKKPFFDNKKGIHKIVVLQIQIVSTCFDALSTCKIIFLIKISIAIFGGISKLVKLIVFG
jgi:hypothetical protein